MRLKSSQLDSLARIRIIIKLTSKKFDVMNIKVIKTEDDYQIALKRLEVIFDLPADSPEGDEAEILSILIEK